MLRNIVGSRKKANAGGYCMKLGYRRMLRVTVGSWSCRIVEC